MAIEDHVDRDTGVVYVGTYGDTVTLTKERFESLIRTERELLALEYAGVDNWEGYSDAYTYAETNEEY
jgi:hypothetical protein